MNQPADSEQAPATITGTDFVGGSDFVQVELIDASGTRVTTVKQSVTFTLATGTLGNGDTAATGTVDALPQPLVNGVATFGTGTLSIAQPNEPQFTSYALIPRTTKGALITGPASADFDIFEDGCNSATTCDVVIRGDTEREGEDTYSLLAPGTLGASEIGTADLNGFVQACEQLGQTEIFGGSLFVHETTDTSAPSNPAPVFVSSHITKADMKASANNGQAHISWCTATLTEAPWIANGGEHLTQAVDVTGQGDLLWVGLAPPCPNMNPSGSAPCLTAQTGDGSGGSISTGYLLGGDPPRRT